MTATTTPSTRLHRSQIRRLAWVTWLQQRAAFLGTAALLGGIATVLVISGLAIHHTYNSLGLGRCGDLAGPACQTPLTVFRQRYGAWAQTVPNALLFVPGLLGVFIGAPLVARELESGTFRFAWTQGCNRVKWLSTQLILVGTTLTVLTLGISALFDWWYQPWAPILGRMSGSYAYDVLGLTFAAHTLFGFTLGVLLGTVIKRTVAAMAATTIGWLTAIVLTAVWIRPKLQAPKIARADSQLTTRNGGTIDTWVTDQHNHRLTMNQLNALDVKAGKELTGGQHFNFDLWLTRHHFTKWATYQPEHWFWHLQLIEASAYTAIAALIGAGALTCLRPRVTH